MSGALGWGALAASSLVIGALLGIARRWPDVLIGLVLAFGADAHALLEQVEADRADQRAGAEGQDQPVQCRSPAAGEREQHAQHQGGGRQGAPAQSRYQVKVSVPCDAVPWAALGG